MGRLARLSIRRETVPQRQTQIQRRSLHHVFMRLRKTKVISVTKEEVVGGLSVDQCDKFDFKWCGKSPQ